MQEETGRWPRIPLGQCTKVPEAFTTLAKGEVELHLKVSKAGMTLFEEDSIAFEVKG